VVRVIDALSAARDAGTTVVVATHDDRVLAAASRVVRLESGRVVG
jgi:predicted ABC-type transport system involved in lysophospholipase L1 biosynthesis ATPase subunit